MFVFRNTLGFYQHKRLQSPVGDIDFTGNDDGIKAINPSPTYEDYIDYVKWEINQKKGSDISKNIIQFTDAKDTENSVLYFLTISALSFCSPSPNIIHIGLYSGNDSMNNLRTSEVNALSPLI